ncbi:ATP-binding protein [Sediminicoccus sp. KRV36]|uniref:ATP-binding protein n=1 Tax=Sediminicoccus sp. KRV36 TaxID=3133721 RepID=UPI00200BD181|nr:ATP-binding protein [Sediminicoccus rosea]UPY36374.1 two-component sensor histidine kinase [Sediminicoccus rosea]
MLGTLVALGEVAPLVGMGALALCLAAGFTLAWYWLAGVARLNAALRRAAEEQGPFSAPLPAPRLPAIGEIEEGLARLTRSLQTRAALVVQLRAADEAIVEALPDPLIVLAADRAPLRANRAARRLFGLAEGLVRGDLGALLRHPVMAAAMDRSLAENTPQAVELVLPGAVTRELSGQVLLMQPPLADGGCLVIMLTDRTAARAVERMRVDFVTNASHELRTPLASVMGFIETLRGPARDDPAAQERFLGIMAEQAERMRRLIDDLLGLSRVEVSEHQPPEGEAELLGLLRAEAAAMEPLYAARGIRLVLALPEGPLTASPADADQLGQVARNLLDNALRHAQAEVRLSAEAARLGTREGVAFSVRDDGPGIAKEHIPRLTERFYRVDKGRGRGAGNTGLGLAIVKHILTRHRGQLAIESELGGGSAFRVWVPAN